MSAQTFEVGDTVKLRSGGPVMTVSAIRADGVEVMWMDGAKRQCEVFDPRMLAKFDPGRRGPIVL
jgi:uncharacterized protein YodC (DUF2158 family)